MEKTEENVALAEHVITLEDALNVTIRRDDIDICHRIFTNKNAITAQADYCQIQIISQKEGVKCSSKKS